jgi:hypothetical protein
VNLSIASVLPNPEGDYTGGLVTIYAFLLICGALSMTRALPFGLMLGISRRSYYLGTALLIVALGVVYGLALTLLQALERATGGWGTGLHFFRVPWIMDGWGWAGSPPSAGSPSDGRPGLSRGRPGGRPQPRIRVRTRSPASPRPVTSPPVSSQSRWAGSPKGRRPASSTAGSPVSPHSPSSTASA